MMRRMVMAVAALVLLAGCGGGGSGDSAKNDALTSSTMTSSTMTSSSMTSSSMASGTGPAPDRTIDIEMRDIAYTPTEVTVQSGETVRFLFHNAGQIRHDAFLGDAMAQDQHEKEMRSESADSGSGDMKMDNGLGIKVDPGSTGEITHTFQKGEQLLIGCHEAGHYAAGMKVTVTVT